MGKNRDSRPVLRSGGKTVQKFRSSRGVGTRHQNATGYVPSSGSPSLDELKRERNPAHRIPEHEQRD